jgi:16S rRNA (cytosine967-C5)-methyltransferase
VVDTAVTLMKQTKKFSQLASLTNAVLRKISSHNVESWREYEVTKLPKWLRKRLVHIYDEQVVTEIEKAHMSGAQIDITLKSELDINQWALDLNATVLPTGSLRLIGAPKVTSLKGYDEGCWWVQDAAAALAVKILSPKNGELILDVCAAPGGKTLQLISSGAEVVSIDKSFERLRRLRENLTRTKQSGEVINSDFLTWKSSKKFDAILIDAPCSATGTIRRHPDLSIIKNGTGLDELYALQSSFIDKAVSLLKPNGRLVFATCSLLAEEGELQFKSALQRHNLSVLKIDHTRLGVMKGWISAKNGGIRLRPDYWKEFGGMDGFFIGLAQKGDGLVNVSKAE